MATPQTLLLMTSGQNVQGKQVAISHVAEAGANEADTVEAIVNSVFDVRSIGPFDLMTETKTEVSELDGELRFTLTF